MSTEFKIRNLSVMIHINGFTLWHYKSGAEAINATVAGFFTPAADIMTAGDLIIISGTNSTTIRVVSAVRSKMEDNFVVTVKLV